MVLPPLVLADAPPARVLSESGVAMAKLARAPILRLIGPGPPALGLGNGFLGTDASSPAGSALGRKLALLSNNLDDDNVDGAVTAVPG